MEQGSTTTETVAKCQCSMIEEGKTLVYWKNPVRSGIIFGSLVLVQIILMSMSFLSVIGYAGLLSLCGLFAYRSILKLTGKSDSIGILKVLDADLTVTPEKVKEKTDILTDKLQYALDKLRELFLLKNTVNTVKFGMMLYSMTYIGARLNFLTLCLLATICAFTLPIIHDQRKEEINAVFKMVMQKYQEIVELAMSKASAMWNKKKAE